MYILFWYVLHLIPKLGILVTAYGKPSCLCCRNEQFLSFTRTRCFSINSILMCECHHEKIAISIQIADLFDLSLLLILGKRTLCQEFTEAQSIKNLKVFPNLAHTQFSPSTYQLCMFEENGSKLIFNSFESYFYL